ncbi:Hypothetical predicted protein [Octopus vulgaris]|uniref:Autophagy-related protein 101 n=1 Tax=Octopus vulgaris TaxID=6645 RepID=A0AA36BPW7_OCTVU|nr:Hypothetical predicted protein [Octopus vulgaris]
MDEQAPWFKFENANKTLETKKYHLNIEVPVNHVGVVLLSVLEMLLNMRSEGKRILSENTEYTTSLKKVTEQKTVPPTAFTYEAIANPIFSAVLKYIANEFKRNIRDRNAITEDNIYVNFYFLLPHEEVFVWETWVIKVILKPKTLAEIEENLKELSNLIFQRVLPPFPFTYPLKSCPNTFQTKLDEAWPYCVYFRQGNNDPSDHSLTLTINTENVYKVLNIVFECILCVRTAAKLILSGENDYKYGSKSICKEYVPDLDISYHRIQCSDLKNSLKLQAVNCQVFIELQKPLSKVVTVFMSFYRLQETDSGSTIRSICEKWKIDCIIKDLENITTNIKDQLEKAFNYIDRAKFPNSLRVPTDVKYDQLHKHFLTTLNACSPYLFYIHF